MQWYMSDSEILSLYRTAANRQKEVDILAELNAVSKEAMRAKLRALGENPAAPVPKPPRQAAKRVDSTEARRLWELGYDNQEIAQRIGASKHGVLLWRHRNDLPPNGKIGRPKKPQKEAKETDMKYKERETEELVIEGEEAREETPQTPEAQPELLPEPEEITARPGGDFRLEQEPAMSAEAFLQTLGLLLNKQTLHGGLIINGAIVRGIERVSVCMAADDLQIEVTTC